MKDFLSAREANARSTEFKNDIQTKQIEEIGSVIELACLKGDFYVTWHKSLSKESIAFLNGQGYNVKPDGQKNEFWYTISW